jgi:two-component system sensor histidine kinase KdpD
LIDLSDVIGTALERAKKVLGDRVVHVDLERDLPMLKLDPVLFEQVLFNLLDNAAKYSSSKAEVRVVAKRDGDIVRLQIQDEGEGIPDADLERIFDKFYRVQMTDRKRAGTGLGLAICRGFVEAMGGRIVAGNRGDRRGAVFTITLPVPPQDIARAVEAA